MGHTTRDPDSDGDRETAQADRSHRAGVVGGRRASWTRTGSRLIPGRFVLVALLCCYSARSHAGTWVLNKFSVSKCNAILKGPGDAARTLKAILGAIHVEACSEVPLDSQGRTKLTSIDLHGKGLTDLSPFRLFTFVDGEINLSSNTISDVTPLIEAAKGPFRINLAHNKVKDALVLSKNFSIGLVLDDNEIDDPGRLATLCLDSDFSLRGNRSQRGAAYDRALEGTYRLYASFLPRPNSTPGAEGIDGDALRSALAPKLTRFVSLKDVTADDVIRDAERFYQRKSDIKYRIHLDTFATATEAGSVLATFAVDYAWSDHDLSVPEAEAGKTGALSRVKRVQAVATVTFDSAFRVVGYAEQLSPRRRLKVVQSTWGTARVADVVRTIAKGEVTAGVPVIKIPKGTILESDFEEIANADGGRFGTSDAFTRVIYKGKPIWAQASTSQADDKHSGVYLEEMP